MLGNRYRTAFFIKCRCLVFTREIHKIILIYPGDFNLVPLAFINLSLIEANAVLSGLRVI